MKIADSAQAIIGGSSMGMRWFRAFDPELRTKWGQLLMDRGSSSLVTTARIDRTLQDFLTGRRTVRTDLGGSAIVTGVDLAAEPSKTAAATIIEDSSGVRIVDVRIGVDDDSIIDLVTESATTGVDVPVGWPAAFVELVSAHAQGEQDIPASTDRAWRRGVALRATDRFVHEHIGSYPLSVAADLIAYPAFRWAGIEARLRGVGVDVARDGTGKICEVYPAGALRVWELPSRGYKSDRNTAVREKIVDGLSKKMPWLDWGGFAQRCVQNDDALDAVIAALVARQVHHGQAVGPPAGFARLARQEGWIWLPVQEPEA